MRPRLAILLLALIGVLAGEARAIDGMIDTAVARVDLVVRGVVVEGTVNPIHIKVIETYKGPSMDLLGLDRRSLPTQPALPAGTEVLILATKVDTLNRTATAAGRPWDLSAVPTRAFDVHLRTPTNRQEFLAAVADAARAYPGVGAAAPAAVDIYPMLPVLKDARVESAVAAVARSTAVDIQRRVLASYLLSHFDSDASRAALRSLLGDMTVAPAVGESKWQRGPYVIREWAAHALANPRGSAMGVSSIPSEVGPALRYRPVPPVRGWVVGCAVAMPVALLLAYGLAPCRRTAGVSTMMTVASVLVAAGIVGLYRRSYATTDELMLRLGRSHHELASRRGYVIYTLVRDWSPPADAKVDDWQHSRRLHVGHFGKETPDCWTPNCPPSFSRLGFSHTAGTIAGPFGGTHRYHTARLPLWLPLALALLVPAARVGSMVRRARRRRNRQCLACGYDLRASPGDCPECGQAGATRA